MKNVKLMFFLLLVVVILGGTLSCKINKKPSADASVFHKIISKKLGVVSITFDDGSKSIYQNGFPILKKYGMPATLFLITKYTGEDVYYVDWNQVNTLVNHGWEIGSHTNTHPHLTKLTNDQIKNELDESIKTLHQHGLFPKAFSSPYGDFNERVLKLVRERFSSHRKAWDEKESVEHGFNSLESFDAFRISNLNLTHNMSVEDIKVKILKAANEKKWLVFLLHSIKKGDASEYQFNAEKLEQVVKYISKLVQSGKLEVKTISQMVVKQEKEREEKQ